MKTVILAAGKGTRMGELTKDTPKPLLAYKGKSLLHHKLEKLPSSTTEVIIVIGYMGDKIKEALGDAWNGIPITYIEQKEALGTAHALYQCKDRLETEDFLVLMGDDLYAKEDLDALSADPAEWTVLAYQSDKPEKAGKCIIKDDGHLDEIYEDFDGSHPCSLIYTGVCHLTPELFSIDMVVLPNGEYGLPQTLSKFSKDKNIRVVETRDWKRMTAPEDLEQ